MNPYLMLIFPNDAIEIPIQIAPNKTLATCFMP